MTDISQITIAAHIEMADDSYKPFEIRLRLPIQILTCKICEGNASLPEYTENAAEFALEEPTGLCRCVSASVADGKPGKV